MKLSKMKYGWTKYGGARYGLVRHKGDWFCQCCGNEHPETLPAYMFSADNGANREFIRLCAICENIAKQNHIKDLKTLFKMARNHRDH